LQLKYVGLPLLAVAVVFFLTWTQKPDRTAEVTQAVPVAPPNLPINSPAAEPGIPASVEPHLASLSERIHLLESRGEAGNDRIIQTIEELRQRLEAVEAQLRKQSAYVEGAGSMYDSVQEPYSLDATDPRISEVQQAFENDTSPGVAAQVDLENVEAIFDDEALQKFEFRQIDCTARYCRLTYDDYSAGDGAASIAENELALSLSRKYGGKIVIHGGEREGRSKTIYIELGAE